MNFVANEGVDAQIVSLLRQEGHRVSYVAEMSPGVPDTAVLNLANQENAVLITSDKDFGDLVYRQRQVTQGVVLLRLHGVPAERKADLVITTIRQHGHELPKAFTVITPQKIRVRPQLN